MNYNWYNLFNESEFLAEDIPSRELEVSLEGIGTETILIVRGNYTSIIYSGVMLSVNLLNNNPFEFDAFAVYKNPSGDVILGVTV